MSTPTTTDDPSIPSPSIFRWTLGFLLVGMAWGLTTPFIRRAALDFHPPTHRSLENLRSSEPSSPRTTIELVSWGIWWVRVKILGGIWMVADLLRSPKYCVPLVVNLTGSVWFFLLIGKADGKIDAHDPNGRVELDGADYEFVGISIHGVG
ncbi:MAG: hypothetical protein Q9213_006712 [Squamulea squamosa]